MKHCVLTVINTETVTNTLIEYLGAACKGASAVNRYGIDTDLHD